jgi:hypothetical protein
VQDGQYRLDNLVGKASVNEIVIFSVGSRSAVSIPCEENFILARNLPLHGRKPGSSLLSMERMPGHGPSGEAFWPSGAAGSQPAFGVQIGFGIIRLFSARWPGALHGRILSLPPTSVLRQAGTPHSCGSGDNSLAPAA